MFEFVGGFILGVALSFGGFILYAQIAEYLKGWKEEIIQETILRIKHRTK